MAVPSTPAVTPLTDEEIAMIPSASLPIGPQLAHLVQEFTTLSVSLFAVISTSSLTATPSTTSIYTSLAELDAKLAVLLSMLAEHQRRQRRIETLIASLRSTEQAWQHGAQTLHAALSTLKPIIESGKLDRTSIAASAPEKASLQPATILSYARLLAPFTSAPPSSIFPVEQRQAGLDPSGRTLPPGAFPPFPTEGAMRRGRLQFGREGEEGTGMGETGEVGGESSRCRRFYSRRAYSLTLPPLVRPSQLARRCPRSRTSSKIQVHGSHNTQDKKKHPRNLYSTWISIQTCKAVAAFSLVARCIHEEIIAR